MTLFDFILFIITLFVGAFSWEVVSIGRWLKQDAAKDAKIAQLEEQLEECRKFLKPLSDDWE